MKFYSQRTETLRLEESHGELVTLSHSYFSCFHRRKLELDVRKAGQYDTVMSFLFALKVNLSFPFTGGSQVIVRGTVVAESSCEVMSSKEVLMG